MKKTLFCFFLLSASAYAQERIVVSGIEATGSGGSVSSSIGLIDYRSHANASGSISEGLQHPLILSSNDLDSWDLSYDFTVYPNPTASTLIISSQVLIKDAKCEIINLQGEVVMAQLLEGSSTLINVSPLAPSTYLLNIIVNNKRVRVYSIIKSY